MKFNPIYLLYYFIYKLIKYTTPQNLIHIIPESTLNLLIICLTNNLIAFIISSNLFVLIKYNYLYFTMSIAIIILITYYGINRKVVQNGLYRIIEIYYDKKFKLRKNQIIIFAILYISSSLILLIYAGVNYQK